MPKLPDEMFDEQGRFKFLGEAIISLGSAAFGAIVGAILIVVVGEGIAAFERSVISLLSAILLFLILFMFKIKRDLTWKVDKISGEVLRVLGPQSWTQFQTRATHFAIEKQILCDRLVFKHLPDVIKSCYLDFKAREGTAPSGVDIIIDSGTTLTPCFSGLKRHGISLEYRQELLLAQEKIQKCPRTDPDFVDPVIVHTNSMSGVAEFNLGAPTSLMKETSLVLIGGNPLGRYRATTGGVSLKYLSAVKKTAELEGRLVVSVLTANWILIGGGYDEMHLCARGRGHLGFKKKAAESSNAIILVSPLGKLLKTSSVNTLNDVPVIKDNPYKVLRLQPEQERDVYLLTSFRTSQSEFLRYHSKYILQQNVEKQDKDYELLGVKGAAIEDEELQYSPGGDLTVNRKVEVPHPWLDEYLYLLSK